MPRVDVLRMNLAPQPLRREQERKITELVQVMMSPFLLMSSWQRMRLSWKT